MIREATNLWDGCKRYEAVPRYKIAGEWPDALKVVDLMLDQEIACKDLRLTDERLSFVGPTGEQVEIPIEPTDVICDFRGTMEFDWKP
jgi:hypothetical protein